MSRAALFALAAAAMAGPAQGQDFHYVEPGVAGCEAVAQRVAPPRPVPRGVALRGRLHVRCGFEQGSYTVTLNATDPAATFRPKTMLVNFGRVVGNGAFRVTFSSLGVHVVSTTITSNMGTHRCAAASSARTTASMSCPAEGASPCAVSAARGAPAPVYLGPDQARAHRAEQRGEGDVAGVATYAMRTRPGGDGDRVRPGRRAAARLSHPGKSACPPAR